MKTSYVNHCLIMFVIILITSLHHFSSAQTTTQYRESTFFPLVNQLDGGYISLIDDKLRVEFIEPYAVNNTPLNYTVYNKNHSTVTYAVIDSVTAQKPLVSYGVNLIVFTVGDLLQGYYVLEIENSKGFKQFLRFKVG